MIVGNGPVAASPVAFNTALTLTFTTPGGSIATGTPTVGASITTGTPTAGATITSSTPVIGSSIGS